MAMKAKQTFIPRELRDIIGKAVSTGMWHVSPGKAHAKLVLASTPFFMTISGTPSDRRVVRNVAKGITRAELQYIGRQVTEGI